MQTINDAQVFDGDYRYDTYYSDYYVEYSTSMARRKGETCPYRARPCLDALPRFSIVVPHEEKGRDEKRRGGEDRAENPQQ